eukprot:CAMPEP_0119107976 /NCGR_PEP_ID=MMETSP1180-20130426/12710_1 /TAXON_ID=3052 ORGANISM="Chlamydomonas cf sp, Strain CCMP681" /NCGR_SAMPLE_ID=MMETSP1180 /ASSEMBLY_ACC=CAM_ASM_000741 /LENGTH=77 /DNA_ID=CAMNT_0007093531 /DNA_START=695 /DNA_END=928 /DNA_ORIENTATION=-
MCSVQVWYLVGSGAPLKLYVGAADEAAPHLRFACLEMPGGAVRGYVPGPGVLEGARGWCTGAVPTENEGAVSRFEMK